MKILTIITNDKTKLLLVEVPENTKILFEPNIGHENVVNEYVDVYADNYIIHTFNGNENKVLGTFNTVIDELSFEPLNRFIADSEHYAKLWKNYLLTEKPTDNKQECWTVKQSFISLLKSEIIKTFPLKENPYKKLFGFVGGTGSKLFAEMQRIKRYEQAEEQVQPKIFLIIERIK